MKNYLTCGWPLIFMKVIIILSLYYCTSELTKCGSHVYWLPHLTSVDLWPLWRLSLSSVICWPSLQPWNVVYYTIYDLIWPLTPTKVVLILNFHQRIFWPSMVTMAHSLPHLTSGDPWPPIRSSSSSTYIRDSSEQDW